MNGLYITNYSTINYSVDNNVYSGDVLQYGENVNEILSYIGDHGDSIALVEENGNMVFRCDHISIIVTKLKPHAANNIKINILSDRLMDIKELVSNMQEKKSVMPLIYTKWDTFEEFKQRPRYIYFDAFVNKRSYFTSDDLDILNDLGHGISPYCGTIYKDKLYIGLDATMVIYNELKMSVCDDKELNLELNANYYVKYYAGDPDAIENIFHSSVATHTYNYNLCAATVSYIMHLIIGYYLKNVKICTVRKHTFDIIIKDNSLAIVFIMTKQDAAIVYNQKIVALMPTLGKIVINGVDMRYY